jgi:hypothetical protein
VQPPEASADVDRVAGASEISVQAHDVRKQGYMGVGQGGRSSGGGGGVMRQSSMAAGGRLGAAGVNLGAAVVEVD